ncbi:MAG: glycosyltransferase family 4 protein [Bacteroidales bacterium]
MENKKILFINLVDASFIKMDERILREHFQVITFKFKYRKGWRLIPEIIREFFFVFFNISKVDIVYVWFADYHAVIPTILGRMFGKKVVTVIGGYDAANEPDLNYGVKTLLLGRLSAPLVLHFATHLLPVTRFTFNDMLKNFGGKLGNKSTVIYNCFNDIFKCEIEKERNDQVVTICLAHSKITVIRKGVDYYVELARKIPEIDFYIVGVTSGAKDFLETNKPDNVKLIEKIPQQELKELLCRSKVICQFSRYEAFGIALLEGISAGCYPVGLDYGGTSEILENDLGLKIDTLDLDRGKEAISEALRKQIIDVIPIRKDIEKRFAIEVRKKLLVDYLNNI